MRIHKNGDNFTVTLAYNKNSSFYRPTDLYLVQWTLDIKPLKILRGNSRYRVRKFLNPWLGSLFSAKIEETLITFQKTVIFYWILIVYVGFSILAENSRPIKQIIVPWACLFLWTWAPKTPSGGYNIGVEEILARIPSVHRSKFS